MRTTSVALTAVLVFLGSSLAAQAQLPDRAKQVARGRYLVSITAGHVCHSPKIDAQMTPDPTRLLSGRPVTTPPPMQAPQEIRASLDLTAWAGPWGNSYAANLTSDKETGLGARYTEASFIKTIRTGKKPEGEALAPPMPWTVYRNMTDDDLRAIFAYLMTLKPIKNTVRSAPMVAANPTPSALPTTR